MRSLLPFFCLTAALLLGASSARAQATGADLVLEPLVIAAQADIEHGQLALALARAATVAGALPADSPIQARAQGLVLLAQQRLGSSQAPQVEAEAVLTPLVDAAELDATAGRIELARARLDVVLAHLPATAALAVRASSLRAVIVTPAPAPAPLIAPAPQQVVGPSSSSGPYVTPSSVYAVPSGVPMEEDVRPRRTSSTNWSLAGPGIGLLAGGWLVGWVTTLVWNLASTRCPSGIFGGCTVAGPFGDAILQMLIPIIGPWWSIGTESYRGNDIWFPTLIGVMQPVGLILLIVGLVTPNEAAPEAGTVRVTPGVGGLFVEGWF